MFLIFTLHFNIYNKMKAINEPPFTNEFGFTNESRFPNESRFFSEFCFPNESFQTSLVYSQPVSFFVAPLHPQFFCYVFSTSLVFWNESNFKSEAGFLNESRPRGRLSTYFIETIFNEAIQSGLPKTVSDPMNAFFAVPCRIR